MEIGLSIDEFNKITPYELGLHAETFNKKRLYQQNLLIQQAWLISKLSKAKKIPDLQKLLVKEKPKGNKKLNKYKLGEKQIQVHFNRFIKERRLLLIG